SRATVPPCSSSCRTALLAEPPPNWATPRLSKSAPGARSSVMNPHEAHPGVAWSRHKRRQQVGGVGLPTPLPVEAHQQNAVANILAAPFARRPVPLSKAALSKATIFD